MDASVLIASYNDGALLVSCLESLAAQTWATDRFEVVVVLDGSTDGSEEMLQRLDTPLALTVATQPNRGRAAALNHAADLACGALLIVTDADVVTNPEFVASHIEAQRAADVAIGPIPLSDRSPKNFLTDGVRQWADEHARKMMGGPAELSCSEIYGANLSISREQFLKLGGYRTDLRRTEDFHLGRKILSAGLKVAFCPTAVASQIYDKTFFEWCDDFYQDGRSHSILVREFPDEMLGLKIGHYYPQSATKRILRPLIIRRRPTGTLILSIAKLALEAARRLGLRWRFLLDCQGVIGDALFWRGVSDEIDDRRGFETLIASSAGHET